ncbi:MAG: M48 family metallopeptidase [Clostridia bacterium]|nr:M48 family metallopeptidase [Clostridia bacterium]
MKFNFDYTVIRSKRKSYSLEVTRDGAVKVRVPQRARDGDVISFIEKHNDWVLKKLKQISERRDIFAVGDDGDIKALTETAKKYIPSRVEYWSKVMGLTYTGIRITRARTRYGSCSPKNGLNFSCFTMRLTADEIDYIIVHELAHIKEKNHGNRFYSLIENYLPNYKVLQYSLRNK